MNLKIQNIVFRAKRVLSNGHATRSYLFLETRNKMKNKTAKEIWEEDSKRLDTIKSLGYKIVVIWETQYKKESWKDLLTQWVEENAKENDTNAIRSSVNNYSSADVKLGELLESHGTVTTTDLETENVNVEKTELNDNQQPSS